jgi:hypothetical protein
MRSFHIVLSFALATATIGCSSNANTTDAARKIRTSLCQRWSQCYGDAFGQAYPSGQSQCVDEALQRLTDAQKNGVSPCSDAEVSTCSKDINNSSCDAVSTGDTTKLPSSCQKC